MEMRAMYAQCLGELMERDEKLVLLDADLSKACGTFPLRKRFPDRIYDCGVAEQNMISIAAGLASYGYKPWAESFAPFATRRVCDQIAISVCYAKRNVKIVGTDPGIAAELNGGTHMSLEDMGVVRSIPGLVIFEPTDTVQLQAAMPVLHAYEGPVYMRMNRKEFPTVFPEGYRFDLFKADLLRVGTDVTILAAGLMVSESLQAAETLAAEGISCEVINVHTIKPIDRETILASAKKTGVIVTAENHNIAVAAGARIFRRPERGDYSPATGSPAINAGLLEDWMEMALDLAGKPRVVSRKPDLGCIESYPMSFSIRLR